MPFHGDRVLDADGRVRDAGERGEVAEPGLHFRLRQAVAVDDRDGCELGLEHLLGGGGALDPGRLPAGTLDPCEELCPASIFLHPRGTCIAAPQHQLQPEDRKDSERPQPEPSVAAPFVHELIDLGLDHGAAPSSGRSNANRTMRPSPGVATTSRNTGLSAYAVT